MKKYASFLLLLVTFEMACYYKGADGQIEAKEEQVEYDGTRGIDFHMHTDFLDKLKDGFCVLGPVYETRRKAEFEQFLQDNPKFKELLEQNK